MFTVVKNRMILYDAIWKLMSKQGEKMLSIKIDKQWNKLKNVNMEFLCKFSKY